MSDTTGTLKHWVQTSPADDFWLWAIALVVITIISFYFAFIFLNRKRIIEDTPTSKIRSAAQGYIELAGHGQLMEGQPIIAPLTGKTCTWYEYKVEEHRKTGKNSEWRTIRKGVSDELFLIKDETGQCIIDPEGANVTVNDKNVWYGHQATPSTVPNHLPGNKKKNIFGSIGISVGKKYRYTEKLLHSGESLYAIGFYKTVGGSGAKLNFNEDVRELIREWKSDTEALMKKFDTNKDGEIDLQEWQKVREEAYEEIVKKHSEQKTLPPVHLMAKTNDKRRPFILSAVAEDDLTRRLHYYSFGSISAFIICGIISTLIISMRLAS